MKHKLKLWMMVFVGLFFLANLLSVEALPMRSCNRDCYSNCEYLCSFIDDCGCREDNYLCQSLHCNEIDTDDRVILVIKDRDYYSEPEAYIWENEDRYPTYDYRHGYSYRTTQEYRKTATYREGYYKSTNKNTEKKLAPYRSEERRMDFSENKDYYYEYTSYMRSYNRIECYHYPPKNKLFYISCPD